MVSTSGKASHHAAVSARADSLVGLPAHFTSWKSLEIAIAYYRDHGEGGRVTKRSLGDTPSAVHVRNMLGALNIVSKKGDPRDVAVTALVQGKPGPVRMGLYGYVPRLIDLIEQPAEVNEVREHLIALGAGSRVLTFVLDTVERGNKDVGIFRSIRLPAPRTGPGERRSSSGSPEDHPIPDEVAESIRARIRSYQEGLELAVMGTNPEMVTVLSRELDRAERRLHQL